jgi:two-component system, response regulator
MSHLTKILLAEDDPRDVELTLQGLRAGDLRTEVTVVNDGAQALDYLFRRGAFAGVAGALPALVMLDIKMPRVDGLEVLREVRTSPNLVDLPIVMMTSSREEADVDRAYALGCNAYVVKPVSFKTFIETVKTLGLFWTAVNEPPSRCLGR